MSAYYFPRRTTMKPVAILAIDIETSGPRPSKDFILSIGWCLGTTDGRIIDNSRIDFKPPLDATFDQFTFDNFWKNHRTKLSTFTTTGRNHVTAISDFATVIDTFDGEYDLRIITDNPAFDMGFINYAFDIHLNRLPITYLLNDQRYYRPIFDTDSFNRAFLGQQHDQMWTSDSDVIAKLGSEIDVADHDHWPENDARHIYKLHVAVTSMRD